MKLQIRSIAIFVFAALGTGTASSAAFAVPTPIPVSSDVVGTTRVQQVRYFGRGVRGMGPVVAHDGAVVGRVLGSRSAQVPYDPRPYYSPEPVLAAPTPGGDAASYCLQRFRPSDPRSGTYPGLDGQNHPCP